MTTVQHQTDRHKMKILTTIVNNPHIFEFERQALQKKKLATPEKILIPPHIAHLYLCILSNKPPQSQMSAITNAEFRSQQNTFHFTLLLKKHFPNKITSHI